MRLSNQAKRRQYTVLAFLIPFIGMLMVMIISQYKPFGKYSMLYSDMYHQYYPFFVDFRSALRSGDSLLYNWRIGMGTDYLGLISYYLASPLNLLSVLVPEQFLLTFFSFLVPVKLGLAGMFFAIFLKEISRKNDFSISVFGAFYGVCAWALGFQWNVMWLDTFALLPLVILGEIRLLRDRDFVLYTMMLFLAVFANYYIGFFVCIFVALVFFCYQICRFPGWKRMLCDLGWIALMSILAIGMTAILELPTFAALQTTQSSVNAFPKGFKLNIAVENTVPEMLDAMRRVAGNMGGGIEPNFKEGLPNLYCGVGTLLLAVLYVTSGSVKLRDKLCALGLLLFFNASFVIRQLDYIWHGFHFTNMIPYRFSFLYSFVMLYMAYQAWLRRHEWDWLEIVTAGLFAAALLCCSDSLSHTEELRLLGTTLRVPIYIIYNVPFLALYLGILCYGSIRPKSRPDADPEEIRRLKLERCSRRLWSRALALGLVVVEIAATLTAFGLYFPGTLVSNYPKGTDEAASMIRYMHEREQRNLFFRAETTHSQSLNDGALNGYNGVSAFTSSANVRVTEFMRMLGYGAKNTYNRYCFEESSPVANLFLGLKYMIERDGRDRSSSVFEEIHHYGSVHLLKNTAYLPLGFLAEPELAKVDFATNRNAFVFQNTLFSAATGIDRDVWYRLPDEALNVWGAGATVKSGVAAGVCKYEDCQSESYVNYTFTADRSGFACIHLDLPKRNDFVITLNGIDLYRDTISLPQMAAVCDVEPGDEIGVRIITKENEHGSMTVGAAILDGDIFRQGYEKLSASEWNLTEMRNTFVSGTVDCNRDGLLYTSVPQNGNWHISVDGQEQDVQLVGDCMIGVALTEGQHTVEMRYTNQAFSMGWKISVLCLALFGGIWYLWYKPDFKKIIPKK